MAPHEQILSVLIGSWQSRALAAVTELGLADLLADGPLSVDDLAKRTERHALSLFRLLRALESTGIFTQVSPGVFANTPASECLRKDVPGSQRSVVLCNLSRGNLLYDGWDEFDYSLKTGKPAFDKVYGYDFWEGNRRNPEASAVFNEQMRSVSTAMTPAVTAAYDWSRFPVIADIGGGLGTQLLSILDASPSSRGILFDQQQVLAEAAVHERMQAVAGDFFGAIPSDADAYLLRWVLHDWPEMEARALLKNLRRTLKPTARLILIEGVIPQGPEFGFGKWLDLTVLVSVGGRERTEAEYREFLLASGFEVEEVVPTASPLSLILAKPV